MKKIGLTWEPLPSFDAQSIMFWLLKFKWRLQVDKIDQPKEILNYYVYILDKDIFKYRLLEYVCTVSSVIESWIL